MWHAVTYDQGPYPSWARDSFQYTICYLVGSILGAIVGGLVFNLQRYMYFVMPIAHDPLATETLRRKSTLRSLKSKRRQMRNAEKEVNKMNNK
eukprot:CAMPEP_0176380722 /NCGR_PEP_ID=MMETSP0126-20121128/31335_1 /TAXON_ID=141414 ORGANISM="Strombidinopsis acuminatum, Strain SPMC142" /NCGR_SAMPLE_ID=MMETSP0126 /ASSEMBLY_ACC=CAM_ASM_000229 /LENGTH=92 /DNA_ID=CAMNT_0017744169 /DNA_START=623 /DNA_END=901 /DNA_ORIENTATION=+